MNDLGIGGQTVSGQEKRPISEAYKGYTYFADGDVLLAKITPCFENGKLGVAANLKNAIGFGSSEFMVLRPGPKISARYLAHFLSQERFRRLGAKAMTGAVGHKRVPKEWVQDFEIPLPPLAEQQRIVAILDEAFEGIELASVSTEKALENARELSAAIIWSLAGGTSSTWEVYTIRTLIERGVLESISDGNHGEIHPTKDEYTAHGVPFIMAADLHNGEIHQDVCRFISEERAKSLRVGFARDGDVLISHKGTIGRVARLKTRLPYVVLTPQVTYYRVRDKRALLPEYLYHALRGREFQKEFREIAGIGSTRAYIGITRQLDLRLALPPLDEQARLSGVFDKVDLDAQDLERVLVSKLSALAELKQSLLARAFSGELTAKIEQVANDSDFASPEQAANILAFMHWRHERANRCRFFGHVMGQKTLDLVERIGCVELGRVPYKDAAGPNDRAHMIAAERWAKRQGFFEFVERSGGGYDFKKLSNHSVMLAAAKTALKPVEAQLARVADILVRKDKEEAEVFDTVLAAWNNLVADGAQVTDTAIVYEARENWHPDKLRIPICKFQSAIEEIRQRGLVPDGSAKVVRHRQASLL